jgi:hypothetical protein
VAGQAGVESRPPERGLGLARQIPVDDIFDDAPEVIAL